VLVSVEGRDWLPGRVTALSSAGCHLVVEGAVHAGRPLQIMFPGFAARDAIVETRDGEEAECIFAEP
jgi:hypothetical protein